MNERVFDMARQSGATDEKGSRAEHVFCFTKDELKGFAELIVKECAAIANHLSDGHIKDQFDRKMYQYHSDIGKEIVDYFGVEE